MGRLVLLLVLMIASVLLFPSIAFSASRQEITKAVDSVVEGDFSAAMDATNNVVGGNWSQIDSYVISLNNQSGMKDFAISVYGNDSFILIVDNGTIVNGTQLPPPPTPQEICGDGIDNDGDGLVDEGCPITPPTPADKPIKDFDQSKILRVCSNGDVDDNNGFTTQLILMNDYACQVYVLNGDYEYSGNGVFDRMAQQGFVTVNTGISLGNHDSKSDTMNFNQMPNPYGTAIFSDNATIPSINAYLGIFLLDGNSDLGCSGTQFKFMQDQISSSDATYKFVSIHQPYVTVKSTHGANGQFACWDPLFRGNGIDAVLQAHNHNYQRFDINGLEYFVLGTGTHDTGGNMYPLNSNDWNGFKCLKCITGTNGFTIFDLSIGNATMHNIDGWFLDNNGNVQDKFNLRD